MLIGKLLNPKIDYVFRRIFGFKGNEDITAALLSSILKNKDSKFLNFKFTIFIFFQKTLCKIKLLMI